MKQLAHDVEPVDPANRPAAQLVHTLADAAEYVPVEQATHADDKAAPVLPSAVPAGQPTHPVAPAPVCYVPAAHSTQLDDPVLACTLPAAQLEQPPAPAAEYVPTRQLEHADAPPAAYAPAVQEPLDAVSPEELQ